jgi:hypothetical protein
VSIHADDEFSLKFAVECELDDVVPRDGLAGVVIARHRRGRRRRLAGAFGLLLACAGIGVPVGLMSSGSGTPAHDASAAYGGSPDEGGPVVLRLASYALKLPGRYRTGSAKAAQCAGVEPAVPAQRPASPDDVAPVAAVSSGACVVMMLTPAGPVSGELPRGARQVAAGHYRAWQLPATYWRSGSSAVAGLLIEGPTADLVIGSDGVSQSALLDLVGTGLRG